MHVNRMEVIHRRAVMAAGVLIGFTVLAVAVAQYFDLGERYEPQAPAIASVELVFEDESNGVVAVFDAATGARLIEYGADEGVFVRSVMRGVARQRRLRGEGRGTPVQLAELSDGQLWLTDPVSGVQIYLGAFGPDNVAAFAEILRREEQVAGAARIGDAS